MPRTPNRFTWTSEGHHLTEHTCVDVKVNAEGGVVLGMVGDVWTHDLLLTADQAMAIGQDLIHGADEAKQASL